MSLLAAVRIRMLRRPWVLPVFALLGACAPPSTPGGHADPATAVDGQYVPGQVLVQFRPGVTRERIAEILAANGLRLERDHGMPRAFLVSSAGDRPVPEIIARLRRHPEVEYAEPNRLRRISPPRPMPAKPAPNG